MFINYAWKRGFKKNVNPDFVNSSRFFLFSFKHNEMEFFGWSGWARGDIEESRLGVEFHTKAG